MTVTWVKNLAQEDNYECYGENAGLHTRGYLRGTEERQKAQLITSDYVLDGTLTLLRFRAGHKEAVEFGRWVLQSPLVKVINVDEKIWQAAWEIFVRNKDKDFSFTDCTSFAIM
ncbi:MAG TPA: PIN domain-containing protein [Anaerolineae bacterium]|nr:PIN domain-containing protein [Anaerolineae bacterium]